MAACHISPEIILEQSHLRLFFMCSIDFFYTSVIYIISAFVDKLSKPLSESEL
jgi:hypothetical protein